jgi:hypothetical protein
VAYFKDKSNNFSERTQENHEKSLQDNWYLETRFQNSASKYNSEALPIEPTGSVRAVSATCSQEKYNWNNNSEVKIEISKTRRLWGEKPNYRPPWFSGKRLLILSCDRSNL